MDNPAKPRRKLLASAVSSTVLECGFEGADKECIEILTEILQSFILEIGQEGKYFCELSGRTIPLIGDITLALSNMGISYHGISNFIKFEDRFWFPDLFQVSQNKQHALLQAGIRSAHPMYIPSYFPQLPDPHAYIRTPTHKQPVTEYEAIREKAANQKRETEKALTKFLAKTSKSHSLFESEDHSYPLIAAIPPYPPYLSALIPNDQVFDFEELEYHYLVANRTEDVSKESDSGCEDETDESKYTKSDKDIKIISDSSDSYLSKSSTPISNAIFNNPNIDNPYLRAATLPKRPRV